MEVLRRVVGLKVCKRFTSKFIFIHLFSHLLSCRDNCGDNSSRRTGNTSWFSTTSDNSSDCKPKRGQARSEM